MEEHRARRVSESIREEISEIIAFEMSDPRIKSVDVTDVNVSPDLRHAHVKVAINGDDRDQRKTLAALEHACNFLRHELATRLNLRRMPELHFQVDHWQDADSRIDFLLRRAKKNRGSTQNQA